MEKFEPTVTILLSVYDQLIKTEQAFLQKATLVYGAWGGQTRVLMEGEAVKTLLNMMLEQSEKIRQLKLDLERSKTIA